MHARYFIISLLALLSVIAIDMSADAAGSVQLELVGDAQGASLVFQEWAELLGKAGIHNVRFRSTQDSDKVGIETQGTVESPVYVVTGFVRSRDELTLPGGRFRRSDLTRLTQWLDDLAKNGPVAGRPKKAAFGLSSPQFEKIREDLSTPVGFSTRGMTGQRTVEKIANRLKQPLQLETEAARALADEKLNEDLSEFTCGTALAYVLRLAGYGLLPQATGYAVVKVRANLEVWPVGWTPEKPPQQEVPALFEFLNINVQNVSAATALDAIGKRLKTPVLIDRNVLARHSIDPAKAMVSLPRSRTTYSLALRRLLFQAGMKFEVRHDEAGMPLLWITSVKPG